MCRCFDGAPLFFLFFKAFSWPLFIRKRFLSFFYVEAFHRCSFLLSFEALCWPSFRRRCLLASVFVETFCWHCFFVESCIGTHTCGGGLFCANFLWRPKHSPRFAAHAFHPYPHLAPARFSSASPFFARHACIVLLCRKMENTRLLLDQLQKRSRKLNMER